MNDHTPRQRRVLVPKVFDPETPAVRPFIQFVIDGLRRKGQPITPATVAAGLGLPVAMVEAQWPEEQRTPPSTQALDAAVLNAVNQHPAGVITQPIVSHLSCTWCDVTHEQVQASLTRLVASGAITATLQQVGEQP